MVNIIHLSTAKSWRGGEQQIANLINDLENKNVNQIIICPKGAPLAKYCKEKNHNYFEFKKRFGVDPLFCLKVYLKAIEHKIDLIHAHDAQAHTAAVLNGLFLLAKPKIIVNRRVIFPIKKAWFTKFKYNYAKVKQIICVSKAVQKVVLNTVSQEKTSVIYSAINPITTELKNGELRKELKLPDATKIIGTVAALTQEKGIHIFLETAKVLLQNNQNLHFIIAGKGKLEQSLKSLAQELEIHDKVTFLGFRANVKEILTDINILLFTSKSEGLGTSLLEAMQTKVPIVAFNTGGIPEMIKDNETGVLVQNHTPEDFSKGVMKILNNTELKETLTKNAFQSLDKFSLAQMAQSTLMVYESVLEN